MNTECTINDMVGKTFSNVEKNGDDSLVFQSADGICFEFYHLQDCCEHVRIEDVCGDFADLIGSPILQAEEVSSEDYPAPKYADSYTWTFYKFATNKGSVTVRWLGESNGYYSESVDMKCFYSKEFLE